MSAEIKTNRLRLRPNRLMRAEYAGNRWRVNVEEGTTIQDLTNPSFWGNVSIQLRKNDEIRAVFDDGSLIVDLIVIEIDLANKTPVWAKVAVLNIVNIAEAINDTKAIAATTNESVEVAALEKEVALEQSESSNIVSIHSVPTKIKKIKIKETILKSHPDYEIKWRGPARLFGIVRKGDQKVIQEDIANKEAANEAFEIFLKQLAA